MSIDKILNVKITALDGGGDSPGSLADDLSVGLGTGDAGKDGPGNGASPLALGDDGSTGAVDLGLAAGAPSLAVADNPAALRYSTGSSKPISVSFLQQSPTSDGSGGSSGAVATVPTVGLSFDSGGDFSQSGGAAIDLFSKGAPGGPGGGSGGGKPPPQYTATLKGMTFVVNWDSSVGSAPAAFVSGFESAVQYFLDNLGPATTPITITLNVGWGEVAGSRLSPFALGESSTNIDLTSFSALQNSSIGSYLPASDPVPSPHSYWVPSAEEKALGLISNNSNLDGAVGFSSRTSWNYNSTTSAGQYDFVSTAKHEISEVMGRIGLGGGTVSDIGTSYPNSYTPFDLFRYSGPGQLAPAAGSTAYFSFNHGDSSGASNLAGSSKTYFNTTAGGDISDWASSAGNDAYNAFSGTGAALTSTVDRLVMDVLGYGTPTV
jgi:hypothetical protein